ncbi:TnsD family Tn7-like transposition protein [Pseudoalteromonas galatheae]|uniref:TnsD family Tn7-like transposition protein n=1 Tax=Pseudoalteromonas galatheae TaxID=579562 RepID=UPI0014330B79|nr:TnsD family Tn7-like transposition protein [Pseudoalteromonas galatheae]
MRLLSALSNETLYGRLMRSLTVSGMKTERFLDALLGSSRASIHPYLTSNLNEIANACGEQPHILLRDQTLFPLFSFYLPSCRQAIDDDALSAVSAWRACQLANFREHETLTLKYCPICAREDMRNYGLTYWHLNHQTPGIEACHLHCVWLIHVPLPARPHIAHGICPSLETRVRECSEIAYQLSIFAAVKLEAIRNGDTEPSDYHQSLKKNGYITSNGHVRRKALVAELFKLASQLEYPDFGLLPKAEDDFKYLSSLVKESTSQHPFKHLLLGFFIEHAKTKDVEIHPDNGRNLVFSIDLTERCKKLLLQGLSMAEVSRRTGKSRCYLKCLALKENIPLNLKPRVLNEKMRFCIINLARKGFHRREIAKRFGISCGSVEMLISTQTGLVSHRKKCKFESRRRRYKHQLLLYIELHPQANRQQCKEKCNAAFFWLLNHEPTWLEEVLPAATPPIRHDRVDWCERDKVLASQAERLLAIHGADISLAKLDRLLGGHGWLLRYSKKIPLTMNLIRKF